MNDQTDHARWRTLYYAGAVAPLIALLFYLLEFSILFLGVPYPATVEGWYALIQRSKLLGLWYLNALDILSFALLGIMFLALFMALRRIRPSWMLIALYLALLGVVVFIVPRVLHLSLLPIRRCICLPEWLPLSRAQGDHLFAFEILSGCPGPSRFA